MSIIESFGLWMDLNPLPLCSESTLVKKERFNAENSFKALNIL